jgi:hypothetical protein
MVVPLVGLVPLAIVGGISGFSPGDSALYQRVWTMIWLVFGCVLGPFAELHRFVPWVDEDRNDFWLPLMIAFSYGAPAIGGYVVVAQMISEYGECFEL